MNDGLCKIISIRLILALSSFLMVACSGPGYYLQAAAGQWKLNQAKQEISELATDPATPAALMEQLQTATDIIAFAKDNLDLPAHGSYSSYVDLGRDAVTWNVIATPAYSLKPKRWCFLIAGCFPYRGFFHQESAEKSARKYAQKGWDVHISPATAYSTLGKFNDPLLNTMFMGSDIRLAAYLFHELAHQRVYTKSDGRFNENYASFVETTGVKAWLEAADRNDELQQWLSRQQIGKDFALLIGKYRNKLVALYQSNQTETEMAIQKSRIFEEMRSGYQQLVTGTWDGKDYYANWFAKPINNARLALFDTYDGGQCAFRHLLNEAEGNMIKFNQLAEEQAKLSTRERNLWLNQTCPVVAPATDL